MAKKVERKLSLNNFILQDSVFFLDLVSNFLKFLFAGCCLIRFGGKKSEGDRLYIGKEPYACQYPIPEKNLPE